MKKIAIITGGSKGLGKGLVKSFLAHEFEVVSLARTASGIEAIHLKERFIDLSNGQQLAASFQELLENIEWNQYDQAYLIHNAASLGTVAPLDQNDAAVIEATIHLNYTSPALLNSLFIAQLKKWKGLLRIVQISSGAANKPYFGWSLYCSSKAALDMLTKTLALENAGLYNFKICSVDPGVMDTNMQAQIRMATEEQFPSIERFLNYKRENWLIQPEVTANAITATVLADGYENGAIFDVKHLIYK